MCEYCDKGNTEDGLRGSDGIYYDVAEQKYYLYIEHFRNEKYYLEVNFCPECGLKLEFTQ